VIAGEPNVGKSSLFNALLARQRAIVSPIAGTTRDTIESEISLVGMRITFVDTAGVRETSDAIEALGVQRTREALSDADVVLCVFDGRDGRESFCLDIHAPQATKVVVANKCDLAPANTFAAGVFAVSATTGEGIESLLHRLGELAQKQGGDESTVILSVRQFELLTKAAEHMRVGINLLLEDAGGEFIISDLQEALRSCMQILGREFDDQVIDRVFKDFCLGK
jgi:tRNA modification GTPase